jgi:hypothetical protein
VEQDELQDEQIGVGERIYNMVRVSGGGRV